MAVKGRRTEFGHELLVTNDTTGQALARITVEIEGKYTKGKNAGLPKMAVVIEYGTYNGSRFIVTKPVPPIMEWYNSPKKQKLQELAKRVGESNYKQFLAIMHNIR